MTVKRELYLNKEWWLKSPYIQYAQLKKLSPNLIDELIDKLDFCVVINTEREHGCSIVTCILNCEQHFCCFDFDWLISLYKDFEKITLGFVGLSKFDEDWYIMNDMEQWWSLQ